MVQRLFNLGKMLPINSCSIRLVLTLSLLAAYASCGRSNDLINARQIVATAMNLGRDFFKINKYLEDQVNQRKSCEPDALMEDAVQLLEKLRRAPKQHAKTYLDALEVFTSLRLLADESSCGSIGSAILEKIYTSLSDMVRYEIRPIDKLANEFARRHVRACASVYPREFADRVEQVDRDERAKVEAFARHMIEAGLAAGDYGAELRDETFDRALASAPTSLVYLMDKSDKERNLQEEACNMYSALRRISGKTESEVRQQLAEIFEQNLVAPCEHYAAALGERVFEPLRLDYRVRSDNRLLSLDEGSMDYRVGMASYQACRMYVLNKDKRQMVARMGQCLDILY